MMIQMQAEQEHTVSMPPPTALPPPRGGKGARKQPTFVPPHLKEKREREQREREAREREARQRLEVCEQEARERQAQQELREHKPPANWRGPFSPGID